MECVSSLAACSESQKYTADYPSSRTWTAKRQLASHMTSDFFHHQWRELTWTAGGRGGLASVSKVYGPTPMERHLFTCAEAPRRWQEAHRVGGGGCKGAGSQSRSSGRLWRRSEFAPHLHPDAAAHAENRLSGPSVDRAACSPVRRRPFRLAH